MDGFINVNKAQGMTSFAVIRKLKKIFPGTKLGHLGTLDPMAQGVLPVAIGYATRLIEYVSTTDKVYRATMTLGGISDTQDAWGNIVYQPDCEFDASDLPPILASYTGIIRQIPPMYSAVHYNGERLYELARQGITVDREPRQIQIDYISLLGIDRDDEGRTRIDMEVGCSKGTYIRTLCHDIGLELGTGAYLSALTRTRAGTFRIEEAHSLEEIQQCADHLGDWIEAVDFPLRHLERVTVKSELMVRIFNGNRVAIDDRVAAGTVRIYDPNDRLVAIADCMPDGEETVLQPFKVFRDKSI